MAKEDIQQIIKEIKEETDRIWLEEPIEVKRLRKGIQPGKAGSYKQNFGNLVFCNGDMRALATWITPNLMVKSLHSPDFTLDQCKKLFSWINILNIDFLAYCGFVKMGRFIHDIVDSYENIQTKEEFFDVLKAWYAYANRMYFWVHHKFPWSLGDYLPCIDEEDIKELNSLLDSRNEVVEYFEEFIPMLKEWKTKQ
jgi:hypothetical protein